MNEQQRASMEDIYKRTLALRSEMVELLRSNSFAVNPAEYALTESGNPVYLDSLFGTMKDLVVIHNMGRSCRYCTLWADGLNGLLNHLQSRTAIVLVNRDPDDVQIEFAQQRGWGFRVLRDTDGHFTKQMGFAVEADGDVSLWPGYSTFHRNETGTITRVGFDMFGPGDMYMPVFPMFELLEHGLHGWEPQYQYNKPLSITLPEG